MSSATVERPLSRAAGRGSAESGPVETSPRPPRAALLVSRLRACGRALGLYPIPFLALAGLAAGSFFRYLSPWPQAGSWIWFGTLLAGGLPLVVRTGRRLLGGKFASDVIAMLAILAALLLDQAFAGVIIVLMQSGGEALDLYAFHRASSSLEELLRRAPRVAHRRTDDRIDDVPVEAVKVGDRLVLRTGDVLPVDGIVASAEALLDESTISGEPLPRRRASGESVVSGTLTVGPPFELVAERPAGESQYARIVELVRSAQERKPTIQRLADRYAVWFTPLTLAVAAIGWWFTNSPQTALSVLVVATPCPLIIATPIAVVGAVNRASDRGLVVKSGVAIEEIGRAQAVVFDKTGTITSGQPEVERIVELAPTSGVSEILRWSAALEALSSHPLAAAIVRAARVARTPAGTVTEVEEFPGAGMAGVVDGHRVVVGSASLVRSRFHRSLEAEIARVRSETETRGRMLSFVLVDGVVVGAVLFADRVRPGVHEMVDRLTQLGVRHVVLLTGDSEANAREVAEGVGIREWKAELLPEQKVDHVRAYRNRYGSTVMVGDGINDAAALAAASVGVAMGARGAAISAEAADVVLLVDDVTRVVEGVSLGQRMVRIARQGILFGLGASLILMTIAAAGHILPAFGAVLQELIDVAVIFNALRVR